MLFLCAQVMNVNISEGDRVVFEDVGRRENSMLANESILMRGLVVRSHSNQLAIRFHSSRPDSGMVLLRYQGKTQTLIIWQYIVQPLGLEAKAPCFFAD